MFPGWDAPVGCLCKEHGIMYQGFSILIANWHVVEDRLVQHIALKLNASVARAVFRFAIQVVLIEIN